MVTGKVSGCVPAEALEFGVVAVRRDPFTSVLEGERGEPGVLNKIAGSAGLAACLLKDLPMPGTGLDDATVRLGQQDGCKFEGRFERTRLGKNTRIGRDPYDGREYLRRHAVGYGAVHDALQPGLVVRVITCVGAERI